MLCGTCSHPCIPFRFVSSANDAWRRACRAKRRAPLQRTSTNASPSTSPLVLNFEVNFRSKPKEEEEPYPSWRFREFFLGGWMDVVGSHGVWRMEGGRTSSWERLRAGGAATTSPGTCCCGEQALRSVGRWMDSCRGSARHRHARNRRSIPTSASAPSPSMQSTPASCVSSRATSRWSTSNVRTRRASHHDEAREFHHHFLAIPSVRHSM